jgi:hypothetical protein
MQALSTAWTLLRYCAGKCLNVSGVPGPIADGDYRADVCRADIRARVGPLFTVVSVNGLDIYFDRFTGKIDGVGFSPSADCTAGATPGSADPDGPPAEPHRQPRRQRASPR